MPGSQSFDLNLNEGLATRLGLDKTSVLVSPFTGENSELFLRSSSWLAFEKLNAGKSIKVLGSPGVDAD